MEIKLENIKLGYSKKEPLINDLNMTIAKEKITFVIGEGGCGKTLLGKTIIGEAKLKEGKIIYRGFKKKKDALEKISYIDFDEKLPFFKNKVSEEITYYDKLIKEDDLNYLLKEINLDESYKDKLIENLSMIEKRKLMIGLSLVQGKELLILDNPTELLDPKNYIDLVNTIKKIKKNYHMTVLILSSDIELTNHLSDMIYIIGKSHILFSGDKFKIYKEEEILNNYGISVPQIASFVNYARNAKGVKLTYREDIKDLIKDIYRNAK